MLRSLIRPLADLKLARFSPVLFLSSFFTSMASFKKELEFRDSHYALSLLDEAKEIK